MVSCLFSGAIHGVDARIIRVEISVDQGVRFYMSGLPDNAIKESQHRVESALRHSGYFFPRKKTVINLAPADIRKEGSGFDLAIALGILLASEQIVVPQPERFMILGELTLEGLLRPVKGSLSIAIRARKEGFQSLILPVENAREAAVVQGLEVFPVRSLTEAATLVTNPVTAEPLSLDPARLFQNQLNVYELDFADVQGQEGMKRAMEIAAAGGHNLIMIGPPGAGKTMLAKRLPSILPPLTLDEALETTRIHSVAGKLQGDLMTQRPFRAPHHSISDVALVGGGGIPQPGEISLAHHGVLFLDELPEFKRTVLEVMRQPLEERRVTISRARHSIEYPANFMLVASMNPCPCGYYNHPTRECVCGPGVVQRYLGKVSGPLLDRIDLHIEVVPVTFDEMSARRTSESSATIRHRVLEARARQRKRFEAQPYIHSNAMMPSHQVKVWCEVDSVGIQLLKVAMERLGLSARAYDRILKVSRTIADLAGSESIRTEHLAEAIQYRSLDRQTWGN